MANGMATVCLALALCASLAVAQTTTTTDALATLQQQAAAIPGQATGLTGQVGEAVASAAGTTRDAVTSAAGSAQDTFNSAIGGVVGTGATSDPVANALGQLGMSPDTTTGSVDTTNMGMEATPGGYGESPEPVAKRSPAPTRLPPTIAVISQTPSAVAAPDARSSGTTAAVSVAAVLVGGLAVLAL